MTLRKVKKMIMLESVRKFVKSGFDLSVIDKFVEGRRAVIVNDI